MILMESKKSTTLLLVLLLSTLLSTALAGRQWRFFDKNIVQVETKEIARKLFQEDEVVVHARILKVQTNDYGSYETSPSLSKPPFKLIPN